MSQTAITFIEESKYLRPEWVREHGQKVLHSLKHGMHHHDACDYLKKLLGDEAEDCEGHVIITVYEIMEQHNIELSKPRHHRGR